MKTPEPPIYEVRSTPRFRAALKRLHKKYPSVATDVQHLVAELEMKPTIGSALGQNCYKIRLAISSKGRGKSGGARVITYVVTANQRVVLLTIYDKSDRENLAPGELDELVAGEDE